MDTATLIAIETSTTTTTTTTFTPTTNTAICTIHEMTTTPKHSNCVADMCHIIALRKPIPNQLRLKTPTSTTATNSDNNIVTVKQQENEKRAVGREEEGMGMEKQDRASKQKVE